MKERVVDRGGEEIVGCRHCVQIAGEMQVDVVSGQDLGLTPAGAATLDPKDGTHRRLTKRDRRVRAGLAQRLGQADRRGGLAFTGGGRGHPGHEYEIALWPLAQAREGSGAQLRLVATVELQVVATEPQVGGLPRRLAA